MDGYLVVTYPSRSRWRRALDRLLRRPVTTDVYPVRIHPHVEPGDGDTVITFTIPLE